MPELTEEELESRREATESVGHIGSIIAAIKPEKYYDYKTKSELEEFKKLAKKDFWKAANQAKSKSSEEHKLIYQSTSETLEPVYFWILDLMNSSAGDVEKLVDNFVSSPGSGHFSELMGKATRMQEEANKIMQTSGVLIKSIVNMIYSLKEFEIRLSQYKDANSKDKERKEAGLLALKQIWMDNVDIKRGTGSINAMTAGQLQFVTLRDAFMAANSLEEIEKMDLNDRVKRILKPRLQEFLKWRELSERELTKRYSIEKTYLKNQLNALKLYARWSKPYLKAATQLEQKSIGGERQPALVTAFNTILLELTLLGKKKVDLGQAVVNKQLPLAFKNEKLKRDYYSCVLVDFYFRGIPQRLQQHYVFGGRVEVTFRAYGLNEQELKMLTQKLDESDINDALKLVTGMTDESLKELQEDISYFLEEEEKRAKLEEETEKTEDVNPFAALIGLTEKTKKTKKEKEEEKKIKEVKSDNYVESLVRKIAELDAKETCFKLFDVYKKAHGMASPGIEPEYGTEEKVSY